MVKTDTVAKTKGTAFTFNPFCALVACICRDTVTDCLLLFDPAPYRTYLPELCVNVRQKGHRVSGECYGSVVEALS